MATKYIGKTGARIGESDDEIDIMAESADEAMRKLLGYADHGWPESDAPYEAVCWVESVDGQVLLTEEVEVSADGLRVRD
ncbi:MAG: hypothetical protein ACOY3P_20250 [Planctomycetota bacterium]